MNSLNAQFEQGAIEALLKAGGAGRLAVIAHVDGPSYRPVGAMMAVFEDQSRNGSLSSGCVEGDITTQLNALPKNSQPKRVRYGKDSPFKDIILPCGGGLDVLLLPNPDLAQLREVQARQNAREPCCLDIDPISGEMQVKKFTSLPASEELLSIEFLPELRFYIFGKGPEAATLASLVQSCGYSARVLSPDQDTLNAAISAGCETHRLDLPEFPEDLDVDARTAIALFFHDHDWEPPILAKALETNAFYIGAQGSLQARNKRLRALAELGVPEQDRARLYGPIGLVPSARDPRTLAVSVLAEILDVAK